MLLAEFLIYANMLWVFASLATLIWGVSQVGRPLNTILILGATLAAVFGGAYLLLVIGAIEASTFVVVARWVGLITWPVVWIAPTIGLVRWKRKANALIIEAAKPANVITPIKGIDLQVPLNRDDYSE